MVRLFASLPKTTLSPTIGKQALRSGTNVAANFCEASRARSDTEFAAKLGIVEQELDETLLWFGILVESKIVAAAKLAPCSKKRTSCLESSSPQSGE